MSNINLNLIKYYYDEGVYSKEKMCELIETCKINRHDFLEITGLYYDVVKGKIKKQKEKGYLF